MIFNKKRINLKKCKEQLEKYDGGNIESITILENSYNRKVYRIHIDYIDESYEQILLEQCTDNIIDQIYEYIAQEFNVPIFWKIGRFW